MNSRDNIKPKTIRLSILAALADGAITTIDDLQIKIGEPRKKVAQNVYPAAIEGLIRRVRDDITGGPAYQITESGREHLRKYADGSDAETSLPNVPVCANSQTPDVTPRVKAESVALGVLETSMPGFTGQIVAQKDAEIARMTKEIQALKHRPALEMREMLRAMQYGEMTVSRGVELLEMWLAGNYSDDQLPPVTNTLGEDEFPMDVIARLTEELRTARAELELSRLAKKPDEPALYVLQRPAKPLVRFTKRINAETRALSFARSGQRAQVFALTLIGTAVPGAEWRKA